MLCNDQLNSVIILNKIHYFILYVKERSTMALHLMSQHKDDKRRIDFSGHRILLIEKKWNGTTQNSMKWHE